MGSSFLTVINLALGFYCVITFVKFIFQFGLPNHPGRFLLYLEMIAVTAYFVMQSLADFWILNPFILRKMQSFPIVVAGTGLLLQVVTCVGNFSVIQQKMISRLPLIAALLFFTFFEAYAYHFLAFSLLLMGLFLSVSVGKSRYQKRQLVKMLFFLGLACIFTSAEFSGSHILGQVLIFPTLFYFFIFQQSYGVSALVDDYMTRTGGVAT
jgi:hypothetical protein